MPPFAIGARKWGEFVSAGGSPNPELPSQRLAVPIPDAQIQRESSLTFVWVPRGLNARAAHLSHAAEGRQHPYAPPAGRFANLDGLWGPHPIDRFAFRPPHGPLLLALLPPGGRGDGRPHGLRVVGRGATGSFPPPARSAQRFRSCAAQRDRSSAPPRRSPRHRPRGGISCGPGPAGPLTRPALSRWATLRTLFPARPGTRSSPAVMGVIAVRFGPRT